jgi:NAD-dependent deacetylase
MQDIETRLSDCDLFIAIGTSGQVYPAAGFVRHARAHGATTVEINREPSEVTGLFHHRRQGLATVAVAELVGELLAG